MAQIPNAGAYLEQIASAKSAYDRAVASLKAQRAQRQVASGLLDDWSVDPRAQYGSYQAMLQTQGMDLDRAFENSQQRGFFGKGLGNQAESMMRYGQAVQMLGFKNQLQDWEREYAGGMADAKRQQEMENLSAMREGYMGAVEGGDWGNPYPPVDSGQPPTAQGVTAIRPPSSVLGYTGRTTSPSAIISNLRQSGILNPNPTQYKTYRPRVMNMQQKRAAAGRGYGAGRTM